ncbi:hypothetical protein Cni_G17537 [Canna indica]|uniref:EF-hand domain-containing protein n=1 Tax=Canna indica TaxID=4628 RepID=A0AAQ3KH82_9LILI|nr:hypothetical protein Cni_G17537 [Canna indica]
MSNLRLLEFQYHISKTKQMARQKARRIISMRDRQISEVMPKFEPNEEEMKRVFYKISNNKDKIELNDFKVMLQRFELCHGSDKAKEMWLAADVNKDGVVDFDDFMQVNRKGGGVSLGEIKNAFWMFDNDRDGRITAKEVKNMMDKLGERCSLEDCRLMVKNADRNGDGVVDMDEFVAMMTSNMKEKKA